MAFNKTHALIQLAQTKAKDCSSRAEARALLEKLQNHSHIILDFKDVAAAGGDFLDEVFRVFKTQHPRITIEPINMNEAVKFAVTRSMIAAAKFEDPLRG